LEKGRVEAKTDYVLATDCDVLLEKDTIMRLVSILSRSPENVCSVSAFCGYKHHKSSKILSLMNKHERVLTRIHSVQGLISSSAMVHGTCYVYKKNKFPEYDINQAEDEISVAINIQSQGYRALTDHESICFQEVSGSMLEVLIMLVRHVGRQIITLMRSYRRVIMARSKVCKFFIFPCYIVFPRCLPLVTFSIFLLAITCGIAPFKLLVLFFVFCVCVLLIDPFWFFQIIAIHLGWIYAIANYSKGSYWKRDRKNG